MRHGGLTKPRAVEGGGDLAGLSSMSHTPGPWAWTYDGSSDYSLGPAADPQVIPVATVYDYRARDASETEANLNLMAAAPDLLAALKAIVEVTEGIYRPDLEAAELAIAKAEGR